MSDSAAASTPKPPPAVKSERGKPLFVKLKEHLRTEILAGDLKPGQKLPSEAKLSELHGISRITVRQSLAELQIEGLIETHNGKGSFVTHPGASTKLGTLMGFYDYLRTKGIQAHGKTLSVKRMPASSAAAKLLHVQPKTELTRITCLRFGDDVPLVHQVLEVDPAIADRLLELDMGREDVMSLLEDRLGYRLEFAYIETLAVAAKVTEARLLQVPVGTPLLRLVYVPHDINGKPLAYSLMHCRSDLFTYRAIVRR